MSELSKQLEVGEVSVRKGLETWIDHGIIGETEPNVFAALEESGNAEGETARPAGRNINGEKVEDPPLLPL